MRIKEIDGLRAGAVMGVIGYHFLPGWFPAGFVGVFLVISGYVITASLVREEEKGSVDLAAFYVRRTFRILPALAAMFFLVLAVAGWQDEAALSAARLLNWYLAFGGEGGLFVHTWTLSAEEQFYFLWPPLFMLLPARFRLPFLAASIVLVTLWRWHLWDSVPPERIHYGLDTRADGLLIGCLLAVSKLRAPKSSWPVSAVFLLAVCFVDPEPGSIIWLLVFSVVGLATASMIAVCLDPPPFLSALLTSPLVQWIGSRSYGLYLWHFPIYALLSQEIGGRQHLVVSLGLTFVMAELSHRLVERPFIDYGRSVMNKRRAQVA